MSRRAAALRVAAGALALVLAAAIALHEGSRVEDAGRAGPVERSHVVADPAARGG